MLEIPCEITTLPEHTGCDYFIVNTHGSCGIQRKDSSKELIQQMQELQDNILIRLCNFTDNPVLLIEESHKIGQMGYLFRKQNNVWLETGMHSSSYYGFIESMKHRGIDVVCTRDLDHSIWYMAALHGYLGRFHYPKHAKTHRINQMAVGMLACVPGIAEKRAREALEHQSIREMCAGRMEGLTVKQAEKVRRVLEWKGS
jgi:ERCC4-type nuclease